MTADLVTDEAVETAARAYIESGLPNVPRRAGRHYHAMHAALTAAAPHIAAQAKADLRAGIEALRDKWRKSESEAPGFDYAMSRAADALDVLLRGAL